MTTPTIGRFLGAGGFGEVYQGYCPVHHDVAVKIIGRTGTDDEWKDTKDRLVREAEMMSGAAHPNVVPVYYVHVPPTDDAIWLIMKLCDGSVGSDYETGPMPLDRVRATITGICQGLAALHSRGMVHRDIKPANILVDGSVFRLSDFGLVTDKLVLGYASRAGYYDHLAPEVWTTGLTSVRTDIWALGMTVYRLLHGHEWYTRWYDGPSRPAHLIRAGGFARGLKWLPHVPKEWRRVVNKAMHDDSHGRYQSAEAFLNALARLPVEPSWACNVEDDSVTWTLRKGARVHEVVWTEHSPRRHSWSAVSRPADGTSGRDRTLGGSDGMQTASVVRSGLEGFFR